MVQPLNSPVTPAAHSHGCARHYGLSVSQKFYVQEGKIMLLLV